MPEQPDVIGGPGVAAYEDLITLVNNLLAPLGLTSSDTLATFITALETTRDKQGA